MIFGCSICHMFDLLMVSTFKWTNPKSIWWLNRLNRLNMSNHTPFLDKPITWCSNPLLPSCRWYPRKTPQRMVKSPEIPEEPVIHGASWPVRWLLPQSSPACWAGRTCPGKHVTIPGNLIKSRWFNQQKCGLFSGGSPKMKSGIVHQEVLFTTIKSGDVPKKKPVSPSRMWIPQESGHHWIKKWGLRDHMGIHQRISVWPSPGGLKIADFFSACIWCIWIYIYMEWLWTSALSRLAFGVCAWPVVSNPENISVRPSSHRGLCTTQPAHWGPMKWTNPSSQRKHHSATYAKPRVDFEPFTHYFLQGKTATN